MSRSKKKKSTSAGQRRQDEIQKRIQKASENAEKKKSGGSEKPACNKAKAAAEKPVEAPAVQEKAPEPEKPAKKPERRKPASRRQPAPPVAPSRKSLVIGMESGPGELVTATFPARLTVESLFKAIRTDYANFTGHLYIRLDGADPVPGGHALSYSYARGMFTRQEDLSGKKQKSGLPVLADLLDARIVKICADRTGPDCIDWHASARGPVSGDPEE